MRNIFLLIFGVFPIFNTIHAQVNSNPDYWRHGTLKASPNGKSLMFEDGKPFFWLGDTGWEIYHRLTIPEIIRYLDNRSSKGFNVIQTVALAEFDGLHKRNRYGDLPILNDDLEQPSESYFHLVDTVFSLARERNLFIGLLPTWGDKVNDERGKGSVNFDTATAYRYGKWLGRRYQSTPNIIWILGGDRPARTKTRDWRPVWRAMARGIKEGTGGSCFITYHPSGGSYSTSQFIQEETWLDMNMFQSGHGDGHDVACWDLVQRDLSLKPLRPTLDAEPNYEDHPVNPWPKWNADSGYFRAYDVRKQIYRSVFAGACGVTYGHHALWQFMSAETEAINYPDRGWINAIDRPGAFQAGYLKKLMESRPYENRMADSALIRDDPGIKGQHIESFRASDNSYAMIYLPVGRSVTLNTSFIRHQQIHLWWYNPRADSAISLGTLPKKDAMLLTSPTTGLENDWVLIVDDARFNYPVPASVNYYERTNGSVNTGKN